MTSLFLYLEPCEAVGVLCIMLLIVVILSAIEIVSSIAGKADKPKDGLDPDLPRCCGAFHTIGEKDSKMYCWMKAPHGGTKHTDWQGNQWEEL